MAIPIIILTEEQKTWISNVLEYYRKNKIPDEETILLYNLNKLSDTFNIRNIDNRLFDNNNPININLFGIYCFEPNNDFIVNVNKIIEHIKTYLQEIEKVSQQAGNNLQKQDKISLTFTSEALSKALNVPDEEVQVCFKLIRDFPGYPLYFNSCRMNPSKENLGYPLVTVQGADSIQKFRQYKSVEESLLSFYAKDHEPRQNSEGGWLPVITSWDELSLGNTNDLAIYISKKEKKGRDYSFVELQMGDKRKNAVKSNPTKTWNAIRYYAFNEGDKKDFTKNDLLRANKKMKELFPTMREKENAFPLKGSGINIIKRDALDRKTTRYNQGYGGKRTDECADEASKMQYGIGDDDKLER